MLGVVLFVLSLLYGCGANEVRMVDNFVPMSAALPTFSIPVPTSPGVDTEKNDKVVIDYSNAADGYITVKSICETDKRMKVIIVGPNETRYTYDLRNGGIFEVFPLVEGDGQYSVGVYENMEDTRYSQISSAVINVVLVDEFAPFIRPNRYVYNDGGSATVRKATELTRDASSLMAKIESIFHYVIETIVYDHEFAETVQQGYIPDVDSVLASGKGICFDFAALMTAMLRSRGIPTKLVVGYAGDAYHAWISTYSKDDGWIDNVIFFNGNTWTLLDPTFASSGHLTAATRFIGDGSSYVALYHY